MNEAVSFDTDASETFWPDMRLAISVMIISILFLAEGALVYGAMPAFYKAFDEPRLVGWIMAAYFLVSGISTPICGSLGDRFGRRRVLVLVMLLTALGGVVAALGQSVIWLIVGHAIQGVGISVVGLVIGMLREHMHPSRTAIVIGIFSAVKGASVGFLFMACGWIVDNWGWPWVFWAGAISMAIAALVAAVGLPDSSVRKPGRIDWFGALPFAGGVGAVLLAITVGSDWGWLSPGTLALFAAGFAGLALWHGWSLRQPSPLIDVRLFGNRQIGLTMLGYCLYGLGALQYTPLMLVLLQQPVSTGIGHGLSATDAGMMLLPLSLGSLVVGPIAGLMAARLGARSVYLFAGFMALIGWGLLALVPGSSIAVLSAAFLFGAMNGASATGISMLVIENAPSNRISEVIGVGEALRSTAMAVGAQTTAMILASSVMAIDGGKFYPDGRAFLTATYVIVGTVIAWLIVVQAISARRPAARAAA